MSRRTTKLCCGSLFVFGASTLFACDTTPTAMVNLDEGGESDVFTEAPVPTSIQVIVVDSSNNSTTLYNGPIAGSGATINLADEDQDNEGYVDVVAWDPTSSSLTPTVHGRTLPVSFGALDSDDPLDVFVQRTGELARMPDTFDARTAPLVDVVTGRYLLVAGGATSNGSLALYDQLSWSTIDSPPPFPTTPVSLAMTGTIALLLDGTANATTYDFSDSTTATVTPPSGSTFDDVVNGATVYADDGTAYIVGGTRSVGNPTPGVLKVATDGTLSFIHLGNPRLNAAATWIESVGLIVIGGSATAPGVEVIAETTDALTAETYPSIAGPMLSAATIDATHVVAGAVPMVYAIPCVSACTSTPFGNPAVTLVHADYFPVIGATTDMFDVGWDASGATHVFLITQASATELALKVPRQQARGLALPNGAIGVIGGANQIESFFPLLTPQ